MKSKPSPESIDLARYAEVTATLRHFPAEQKDEVIARLGLRRRVWEAESARWTAARDAELASGKADLAGRFGSVLTRTRQRLAALRPSLESLGPLPGPDEAEPAQVALPTNAPSPPAEIPMPVPVVHLMPALDMPASTGPSLWARHASFADREPVHAIAPIPLARLAPAVEWSPAALPPPPVLVTRPKSNLASTLPLGRDTPVSLPLPFQAASATPAQVYERAVAQAQAAQGPAGSSREPRDLGSTVALGNDLPAPPLPPGVPDLTLPQYASLRVELNANPENSTRILATYRVTAEGRQAIDAHWRARFEADPLQRMMFARAYASYNLWLKQNAAANG